ncbi:hypothetical protein [Dyadobacter sp. NIV53]|uniref:hypothetical protein n=1 Tax=Dyadobacter sp. NIV53 TaxID=2861765 RepID=UPI001C88BE09|nr:hypothetical protein [Dyadobacter sp. NIV53]
MKNSVKSFLLLFVMFVSLHAHSADNNIMYKKTFDAAVYKAYNGNLRVNVDTKEKMRMGILIKTMDGKILQEDYMDKKTSRFAVSYNFSDLEEGEYQIQIFNKRESETKTFRITTQETEVAAKAKTVKRVVIY